MSVRTAENDAEQPQKDLGEDLVGKAVDLDDRADVGGAWRKSSGFRRSSRLLTQRPDRRRLRGL